MLQCRPSELSSLFHAKHTEAFCLGCWLHIYPCKTRTHTQLSLSERRTERRSERGNERRSERPECHSALRLPKRHSDHPHPHPHPKATTIPPIIGFAHRGAPSTRSQANTLPAFTDALALGAPGLETDIALTADGIPILTHVGLPLPGRPRTSDLRRSELPPHVPSLQDLYEQCGIDFDLSLDMAQPRAVDAVVQVAGQFDALDRLWLTYWRLPELRAWRRRWPDVHLVYPSLPLRFSSATRLVDRLAAEGVDVLNLHYRLCSARLADYAHAKNIRIFAWGIRTAGPLHRVLQIPIDGLYCDNVEAMVTALQPGNSPAH